MSFKATVRADDRLPHEVRVAGFPTLTVQPVLTEKGADMLVGKQLTGESIRTLYRNSVRLLKPDGSPLAVFVRGAIAPEISEIGYKVFRQIEAPPANRFTATLGGQPKPPLRSDGTRGKTARVNKETLAAAGMAGASSGIVGYMDRYTRFPFCRKTAFNMEHPEQFEAAMPFIQAVDRVFAEQVPDRYQAQLAMIRRTSPDFCIPGTAFTTITVNKNYPTRVHKDVGDLQDGFGCMAVLRAGHYTGGYFCMPRWGVAFDCGTGDVMLADVHEWHGNTRMVGDRRTYERVSCVFYYREKMKECGSMLEELSRAKHRRPGDPLYDQLQ